MHPSLQYLVLQDDFSHTDARVSTASTLVRTKTTSPYDIVRTQLNNTLKKSASLAQAKASLVNPYKKAKSATDLERLKASIEKIDAEKKKTDAVAEEIKKKLSYMPKPPIVGLGDPVGHTPIPTPKPKPPVVELGDPTTNRTLQPASLFCDTARCPQGTKCSNAEKRCVPDTPVIDADINVVVTGGGIEDAGTTGELDTIISGGGGMPFIEPTADMVSGGQGSTDAGAGAGAGAMMEKKDNKYILPLVIATAGLVFAILKPIK